MNTNHQPVIQRTTLLQNIIATEETPHKAEQCVRYTIYGHSCKAIDITYSIISLDNVLKLIVCTAARNILK